MNRRRFIQATAGSLVAATTPAIVSEAMTTDTINLVFKARDNPVSHTAEFEPGVYYLHDGQVWIKEPEFSSAFSFTERFIAQPANPLALPQNV